MAYEKVKFSMFFLDKCLLSLLMKQYTVVATFLLTEDTHNSDNRNDH